jgi:amidophosphoribosyltransferase
MNSDDDSDIKADHPVEKCGIFGVFNLDNAARYCYLGLQALQHRGQEASGIAAVNGKMHVHKDFGLVSQVYKDEDFNHLGGGMAIGHNRYSTSGGSREHKFIQPIHDKGESLALVHNGNLPSLTKLKTFLTSKGIPIDNSNDSSMMYDAIKYFIHQGHSLEEAVAKAYPLFTGVFCILVMNKEKIIAAVDPCGIRPLCIGKLDDGYIISSETCGLDIVGAEFLQEVGPGEIVEISTDGIKTFNLVKGNRKIDLFEFIYFARPDSNILGKNVYQTRVEMGINLAKEYPIKADLVIPVPETGIPGAIGYSMQSGIPFQMGLMKNRYIGRTFIMPDQKLRESRVRMKLNPISAVIKNKKIIIVDDSIVRGTTTKKLVSMLKNAGALEVHVVVTSPPVKYPDYYGIDTPNQNDLIASYLSSEEIAKVMGADSVNYLSLEKTIQSVGLPAEMFCTAPFTGEYPIDIFERKQEIIYAPTNN